MRSFYLANADVKQALNLVKGMIKSQDVFIDEKANLLVVKDTPEAMRVVQQLVRSLDIAEPEVMLEVEVLELASSTLTQIGIQYPESVNLGNPTDTIAGGAAAAASPFVLGTTALKGYVVNPPIVLQIKANDADAKILANPRIRVKNREKAKVHIGSKVPVITTTSTANVGVSSSVSYLDVGLKLDVEPNIYLHDEVAIKVGLDVSNIIRQVNVSGTLAYELGTRSTATTLQLKDGETQILAGLISDEDRATAAKIPGLGDIPVLGRLFSSQGQDLRKTEVVLLITPRIVRTLDWVQVMLTDLAVGTDAAIGSAPVRISATAPGALALAPTGGQPGAAPLPRPGSPVPPVPVSQQAESAQGQPVPGQPGPGAPPGSPGVPGAAGPSTQTALAQPEPQGSTGLLLLSAPLAARSGAEIVVSLTLAPGSGAVRATAEVAYDPQQLEAVGAPASAPGRLPLRVDGTAAVRFKVLTTAGRAQVRVDNVVGVDPAGGTVPVQGPGPVDITITP
jgi:general secretion pathway protein D